MTAKQVWRDIFGSNGSLFVETAITPNKPVRIGRKEIGPSYNDYCRLCGLCFNVQYGNTCRNIGFEKMFKPQEISCGVVQLFAAQILCRTIITPNAYAVSVQVK